MRTPLGSRAVGRAAMLVFTALLFIAEGARAEETSVLPLAASDAVPVTILGTEPSLFVQVFHPRANVNRDTPIVECRTPCSVSLTRGHYKLFVHSTERTLAGRRPFELEAPATLQVYPQARSKRSVGLVLGIAGTVALLVGGVMVLASDKPYDSQSEGNDSLRVGGLALFLGGAALTPIGWVTFAHSFKPDVEVQPAQPPSMPSTSSARGSLSPGFALQGVF